MCGIYGSTKKYSESLLKRKMQQFRFRGPDNTGIKKYPLQKGQLVLGHNRLAIIDLSARANQPMEYAGGKIVVVLNGEIYNYQELKKQYFADVAFQTTYGFSKRSSFCTYCRRKCSIFNIASYKYFIIFSK